MADGTKIEWTDATWNIITGCSVISPGCKNCYAMKLAGTRLKNHPSRVDLTIKTANGPVWNGEVRFNPQWLDQPLQWSRPRMVFVCAHGDLFHEAVPDEWIDQVMAVMALGKQHTFQVLTKRAERMRNYFGRTEAEHLVRQAMLGQAISRIELRRTGSPMAEWGGLPLANVWLGVSVEDQRRAEERLPHLVEIDAAVRWISAEPLLEDVDLRDWLAVEPDRGSGWRAKTKFGEQPLIGWVVGGGESGDGSRIMPTSAIRLLRDQCAAANVPFLFKQWGNWCGPGTSFPDGHPEQAEEDELARFNVGKAMAGRELDGRTHDGFPRSTTP